MIVRLLFIFLPSIFGLLWQDSTELSIIWSLAGSILIAGITQTNWFRQSDENIAFTHRLLRPVSMYNLIFVAFHGLGGVAYALNAAGYRIGEGGAISTVGDLTVIAECLRLMLLGHASVNAGMKLAGFRYEKPKYTTPSIPAYTLIVISFISLVIGTYVTTISSLGQLSQKILAISISAISLDIAICIRGKRYQNLLLSLSILGFILLTQSMSGWKGGILWTMITLGALLFPLMPKRVMVGGSAFVLFWALYFYPFGLALRPLLWQEGVEQDKAVELSIDQALNMSLEQRLNTVWEMMVGRANELNQFVRYVEYVPARHAYYEFEIVSDAIIAVVPRILWPEKPDLEGIAMKRVYDAGVVSEKSFVSAKSNYYQDAYLSWGEVAIILACICFGILVILLSRLCERLFGGYDVGTCLIYTSFMATTVNQPPNFEYFVPAVGMAAVLIFALFVLGRATDWILPAGKLSHLSENQVQVLVDQKARFHPLPGASAISSQLFKYRK